MTSTIYKAKELFRTLTKIRYDKSTSPERNVNSFITDTNQSLKKNEHLTENSTLHNYGTYTKDNVKTQIKSLEEGNATHNTGNGFASYKGFNNIYNCRIPDTNMNLNHDILINKAVNLRKFDPIKDIPPVILSVTSNLAPIHRLLPKKYNTTGTRDINDNLDVSVFGTDKFTVDLCNNESTYDVFEDWIHFKRNKEGKAPNERKYDLPKLIYSTTVKRSDKVIGTNENVVASNEELIASDDLRDLDDNIPAEVLAKSPEVFHIKNKSNHKGLGNSTEEQTIPKCTKVQNQQICQGSSNNSKCYISKNKNNKHNSNRLPGETESRKYATKSDTSINLPNHQGISKKDVSNQVDSYFTVEEDNSNALDKLDKFYTYCLQNKGKLDDKDKWVEDKNKEFGLNCANPNTKNCQLDAIQNTDFEECDPNTEVVCTSTKADKLFDVVYQTINDYDMNPNVQKMLSKCDDLHVETILDETSLRNDMIDTSIETRAIEEQSIKLSPNNHVTGEATNMELLQSCTNKKNSGKHTQSDTSLLKMRLPNENSMGIELYNAKDDIFGIETFNSSPIKKKNVAKSLNNTYLKNINDKFVKDFKTIEIPCKKVGLIKTSKRSDHSFNDLAWRTPKNTTKESKNYCSKNEEILNSWNKTLHKNKHITKGNHAPSYNVNKKHRQAEKLRHKSNSYFKAIKKSMSSDLFKQLQSNKKSKYINYDLQDINSKDTNTHQIQLNEHLQIKDNINYEFKKMLRKIMKRNLLKKSLSSQKGKNLINRLDIKSKKNVGLNSMASSIANNRSVFMRDEESRLQLKNKINEYNGIPKNEFKATPLTRDRAEDSGTITKDQLKNTEIVRKIHKHGNSCHNLKNKIHKKIKRTRSNTQVNSRTNLSVSDLFYVPNFLKFNLSSIDKLRANVLEKLQKINNRQNREENYKEESQINNVQVEHSINIDIIRTNTLETDLEISIRDTNLMKTPFSKQINETVDSLKEYNLSQDRSIKDHMISNENQKETPVISPVNTSKQEKNKSKYVNRLLKSKLNNKINNGNKDSFVDSKFQKPYINKYEDVMKHYNKKLQDQIQIQSNPNKLNDIYVSQEYDNINRSKNSTGNYQIFEPRNNLSRELTTMHSFQAVQSPARLHHNMSGEPEKINLSQYNKPYIVRAEDKNLKVFSKRNNIIVEDKSQRSTKLMNPINYVKSEYSMSHPNSKEVPLRRTFNTYDLRNKPQLSPNINIKTNFHTLGIANVYNTRSNCNLVENPISNTIALNTLE